MDTCSLNSHSPRKLIFRDISPGRFPASTPYILHHFRSESWGITKGVLRGEIHGILEPFSVSSRNLRRVGPHGRTISLDKKYHVIFHRLVAVWFISGIRTHDACALYEQGDLWTCRFLQRLWSAPVFCCYGYRRCNYDAGAVLCVRIGTLLLSHDHDRCCHRIGSKEEHKALFPAGNLLGPRR